jgi:hypothetical protein
MWDFLVLALDTQTIAYVQVIGVGNVCHVTTIALGKKLPRKNWVGSGIRVHDREKGVTEYAWEVNPISALGKLTERRLQPNMVTTVETSS